MKNNKLISILSFITVVLITGCGCYTWKYYLINKSNHIITIIYTLNAVNNGPFVFTLDTKIGDLDKDNHHNGLIANQNDKASIDSSSTTVSATLKPNQGLILEYYGGQEDLDNLEYKRSLFCNLKYLLIVSGSDTVKYSKKDIPGLFQHRDSDRFVSMLIE